MTNEELIERYPFLACSKRNDYTWLDEIPPGWKTAFGVNFCEELRNELITNNFLDKFQILQLKEKYGRFTCYCSGYPAGSKISDIIKKYEILSEHICVNCGKPAKWVSTSWISPWCDACRFMINDNFEPLN